MSLEEIIVVDNGSAAGLAEIVAPYDRVRLLEPGRNLGVAGLNVAAREARGEILLMLDDDAYPLPGAIETASEAFNRLPRLGVVGGLVRDVDDRGAVVDADSVGSFDWLLRAGKNGQPPTEGFPAFFFPEGASFARRKAYLETGGYLEPFFSGGAEAGPRDEDDRPRLGRPLPADRGLRPPEDEASGRSHEQPAPAQGAQPGLDFGFAFLRGSPPGASRRISDSTSSNARTGATRRPGEPESLMRGVTGRPCADSGTRFHVERFGAPS